MSSQLKDVVIVIVIVIVIDVVVIVICSLFSTLRMGIKSSRLVCINYQWNRISLKYLSVSSWLLGYSALKVVQKYSSLNNGKLPSRYEKCTFKE